MKITFEPESAEYDQHDCRVEELGRVFVDLQGNYYVVAEDYSGEQKWVRFSKIDSSPLTTDSIFIFGAPILQNITPYGRIKIS